MQLFYSCFAVAMVRYVLSVRKMGTLQYTIYIIIITYVHLYNKKATFQIIDYLIYFYIPSLVYHTINIIIITYVHLYNKKHLRS